jgi:hypothetical protein
MSDLRNIDNATILTGYTNAEDVFGKNYEIVVLDDYRVFIENSVHSGFLGDYGDGMWLDGRDDFFENLIEGFALFVRHFPNNL